MMNGNICYMNGVACIRFKATLLHREFTPVNIVNHDEWLDGAVQPIELKESTFSYSKITLKYFVEGVNEKDTLKNISNLIKSHIKSVVTFSDLNYRFNTKLTGQPTLNHIKDQFYEVTLTLQSDFKLDQDKSITVNSNESIECKSNVDTPAKITITSEDNIENLEITLNDDTYVISSLKNGDVLEINGDDYTIKYNGVDDLSLVDIWRFPVLKSGSNTITINKENISVKIDYTERFI